LFAKGGFFVKKCGGKSKLEDGLRKKIAKKSPTEAGLKIFIYGI
jgi:uncharacterized protein YneR